MGLRPALAGTVRLNGRDLTRASPRTRLRAGIAYVPEDRKEDGLVGSFSVAENLILDTYDRKPFASGLNLNLPAIAENATARIKEFDVRTGSAATPAGTLSGGNQQKVILARELGREHKVLIASQPTRGLDVGSIEFVHRRIVEQRDHGVAVIIVSSELDEIYALADRIAVMYEGKITGFRDPDVPDGRARPPDGRRRGRRPRTRTWPSARHGHRRQRGTGRRDGRRTRSDRLAGGNVTAPPPATEPTRDRRPARRRTMPRRASTLRSGKFSARYPRGTPSRSRCLPCSRATMIGRAAVRVHQPGVLHAWGDLLRASERHRAGLGCRRRAPTWRCSRGRCSTRTRSRRCSSRPRCSTARPRRLPVRGVQPAVGDRGAGDAADPGRPRGGAAVPGRACSTSAGRASSSAARSSPPGSATTSTCRSSCTWSSASSAGSSAARSLGWLTGEIKARTGAHEVIVTIMLNYVMQYLLAYLLSSQSLLQAPGRVEPDHAADRVRTRTCRCWPARNLRINAGFLIALACALGVWWLLNRTTTGFEFRSIGANASAARVAGMKVERTWVLVMLIARRARRAGRGLGHPGHRLHAEPAELRHLRHRRDHRRAARPGQARRRGAGRAAVRRAARGLARHADRDLHPGADRAGAAGADRPLRRRAAADPHHVPAARRASAAGSARRCPRGGTRDLACFRRAPARAAACPVRPPAPAQRIWGGRFAAPVTFAGLRPGRHPGARCARARRRHVRVHPRVRQGLRAEPDAARGGDLLRLRRASRLPSRPCDCSTCSALSGWGASGGG